MLPALFQRYDKNNNNKKKKKKKKKKNISFLIPFKNETLIEILQTGLFLSIVRCL